MSDRAKKAEAPELEFPTIAPDGYVYLCTACGKTSKYRYGNIKGWDASCVMNSVLYKEDDLVKLKTINA